MKNVDVARVLDALGIEHRRKGRRLEGLCPYHEDKSPDTWSIAAWGDNAGRHHCFSCGEGGGILDLIVQVQGLVLVVPGEDREDALKAAKKEARVWLDGLDATLPAEPTPETAHMVMPPARGRVFELPPGLILEPLEEWVTPVRRYAEKRGLTAEQVAHWGIGYAVDCRLGGRIVLVTRDKDGVPAGYMARAFGELGTRYLYPHTREGARLDVMLGEQHWPARRERSTCVVFEGGFNALAFERAVPGIPWGAIGGSEVRVGHLSRLASFPHVVVLTDNDDAGNEAAETIYAGLARRSRVARVLPPAGGPDIDEMKPEDVEALVAEAVFG